MNTKAAKLMNKMYSTVTNMDYDLVKLHKKMRHNKPRNEGRDTELAIENAMRHLNKARTNMLKALQGFETNG
jgi:hypothetical protein